ncbi:hypothetical protein GL325_12200 [Aeromicrobium sp. 636]|uniref:Uncharacterized protein n=1 Tax=Aeromicrobium senzhongii TaxID=2663859 RepID=A0A8I0EX04_9ACTN|nr:MULTISPECIES: hypothetical protein [Aeromicrobium]MBC9227089.1 hypothetical protein [Aeromicrobium senzhongii]MCQ3999189.1 hypothetical protein [Aeromicrobium sp. 636]
MRETWLSETVTRDPRTVPGFDRAVELGLTPRTPADPPPTVTTNSRRLLLAIVATTFSLLLVVLLLANATPAPPWLLGLVTALTLAIIVRMFVRLRRVMWDEISAGYCRVDYMVALFSRDPEYRFPASRMRGAPWDLRGLWRLADDGSVVVEPDWSVLPPGHYPSPNRPGQLELWTGSAWAYRYEEPRVPFL